jgi:nitroreductase
MSEQYDFLMSRRSVLVRNLTGPGPDAATLERILSAGLRVPDHSRLTPFRYLVIRGDARERLGDLLAETHAAYADDATEEAMAAERARFTRAPVVVAVVSRARPHPKIPEWEQVLASGACCLNILNAAHALGYAAQWVTGWCAYDRTITAALGLADDERIAGFIHLGTAAEPPAERKRAEVADILTEWTGPATS